MKQGYVCSYCGDIENDFLHTCQMCHQDYCKWCYDHVTGICYGCFEDLEMEAE